MDTGSLAGKVISTASSIRASLAILPLSFGRGHGADRAGVLHGPQLGEFADGVDAECVAQGIGLLLGDAAQGRNRLLDQLTEAFIVVGIIYDDLNIHVCPFKLAPVLH
jgi:hypothetical protein